MTKYIHNPSKQNLRQFIDHKNVLCANLYFRLLRTQLNKCNVSCTGDVWAKRKNFQRGLPQTDIRHQQNENTRVITSISLQRKKKNPLQILLNWMG